MLQSWAGYMLSFTIYAASSIILTAMATMLVHEYCPAARGSGIPEVKASVSGFFLPASFSEQCLLVKTLGLALAVGAGLALGKEGPLIHIGVCWAHVLQRSLSHVGWTVPIPLHELACVGAAAGVATAFGAPLGGVLFAAEELGSVRSLSRQSLLYAFMAAFAASFMLKYLDLNGSNRLTLFALSTSTHNPKKEWISWEMVAFCFTGLIGGLGGVLFIKLNLVCTSMRRRCRPQGRLWMLPSGLQDVMASTFRIRLHKSQRRLDVAEGVMIALVTALLNWPLTMLLRNMSNEVIHALFETCPHSRASHFFLCDASAREMPNSSFMGCVVLFLAAAVRLIQTSYTFGAAIPSGLFIPSLYMGAAIGRLVGNVVHLLLEKAVRTDVQVHVDPAIFAMVGAIAMLSGFCRMTVSIVVIMLELTGELTYVVPFMCAVLTAKLVGDSLTPSIYDCVAKLNGLAPIEEQHDVRLDMIVADLAEPLPAAAHLWVDGPVPLRQLTTLVWGSETPQRECAAGGAEAGAGGEAPAESPLLLLHGSSGSDVLGVIDRGRLQRWLSRQGGKVSASFEPLGDLQSSDIVDASSIVDKRIGRLSAQAPLLTAFCVFKQKPQLRYCICLDDRSRDRGTKRISILSRRSFYAALNEGRFPLAHPAYSASAVDAAHWEPLPISLGARHDYQERRQLELVSVSQTC